MGKVSVRLLLCCRLLLSEYRTPQQFVISVSAVAFCVCVFSFLQDVLVSFRVQSSEFILAN